MKFYFEQVLQREKLFVEIPRPKKLPESILAKLRTYFLQYKPKKYLFEGQYGENYSIRSAQTVFATALKKAKINKTVGIHGLRHSFATHLLEAGTDISFIQELLVSRCYYWTKRMPNKAARFVLIFSANQSLATAHFGFILAGQELINNR